MANEEMLYMKGSKIWLPHLEEVWMGATLSADYHIGDTTLNVINDNGQPACIAVKADASDLPPLRNPMILIGQNDLTSLSYLHEPGVLYNLKVRFQERQSIYTYCGIILVAINPYAELPLYSPSIIRAYRGRSIGELEPHIFAVAEEAYTKLEREKCDLSIIVSGESGAGKTVSAKYIMRYFASVGGSESETDVERKILASSPILEAFGNAKTTRNDNSSRFGKFSKLHFTDNMSIMNLTGATVHTYLLEKSRVVFQSTGERNYHIFYQLCSSRHMYPELILDHQNTFNYLNSGKCPDIDKMFDKKQFKETLQAMSVLGFNIDQITDILKILAGILHLGNIQFTHTYKKDCEELDPDSCDIFHNDLHLHVAGEMLKINSDELRKWLILRQIESVNENVLIPNNLAMAQAAKDALGKHIYAKLFQYIVSVINKSLNNIRKQNCFIGVLDIYGFESFESNSFEQFCINYANEKLQQQFNQHVFTLEQEEYVNEGITWAMIDFYDNQPCIDLIESKLGILDLLDEECRMPKGSDESWASKIIEKCGKYPHFEKPRFGSTSFFVKHFSDLVEYDVHGFLEKNRDTVSKELVNVISQSEMSLCKLLMELEEADKLCGHSDKTATLRGRIIISAERQQVLPTKQHRRSVGLQFRESLSSLIMTLHATTPHYVRCIKPNDCKMAFKWEAPKIVQQLRACGVLETVRISAAGFPSRWSYHDFYIRYMLLCHRSLINKNNLKMSCSNIVQKWISVKDKYRFGNTQIFFRAGQVAYLEQIRANLRKKYITVIQSVVRRFIYRQQYLCLQKTAIGIQRYARGYLARRKVQQMREDRAALVISKFARGWLCRRRYNRLRRSICGIQQYARGMLARKRFQEALDNHKAIEIQRFVRGFLTRRNYNKRRTAIIICQAAVRGFLARRLCKRMKTEAKTISHIQKRYKGLEKKIISMQQKIDELNRENMGLKKKTSEISILKMKLELKKTLENEVKQMKLLLAEKDNALLCINKELENERDEKIQLLEEKDHTQEEWTKHKNMWRMENEDLRKQIDDMIELAKKAECDRSLQRERLLSEVDTNEINEAYQRALKDKEIIEQENCILKEELNQFQKPNMYDCHPIRSISNVFSQNEDDIGYSSARNTLEISNNQKSHTSFSQNTSHTSLILKLRNILEDEKKKNKLLNQQLVKMMNRNRTTEDSLRVSELEVENEKIRNDYELLRNSIKRGAELHELYAQYHALQEELKRRRDECIQLKAVLQQQSQSLKSFGTGKTTVCSNDTDNTQNELMEAFHAQKLANKQLESELSALTEENNARLAELAQEIDDLRTEKLQLYSLLQSGVDVSEEKNIETLRQNERYLRFELERSLMQYSQLQDEMNTLTRKFESVKLGNNKLTLKLQEYGISDTTLPKSNCEDNKSLVNVSKQKMHDFQGVMKFSGKDLDKILQRLVTSMTTRVAIGLLPGFSAYIIFMCIRYTDLINADDDVRELLSKFVMQIKKMHRNQQVTELRILWLVNSITLLNLLKQYGDVEEYVKYNTERQNQQQLKNFNLFEYRRVVLEIVVNLYQVLVKQIQNLIEPYIVPAILENDEIQRGRQTQGLRGRVLSMDSSPEHSKIAAWKQLLNQLEHFYKQFEHFGLHKCYSEQIFTQLLYFICVIAMNCLMLRGDICMWQTGMIINYNLGRIEEWIREKKMSNDVLVPLDSLNQVSQLLQSRKSEEDVQSICDLCSSLNTAQVLKVMKSYKLDDYESEITNTFLEKLTEKLNKRQQLQNDEFTMDQKFIHPFKVVFKYSDVKLEEIELPKHLKLDELLTKI